MVSVSEQYEAFPYPARDPADEKKRLITGSPSHPIEIDHMLFGGQRDWSKPFRVLSAGGGTGDGLIQLAQSLSSAGKPYEITYVDLSKASREIAEARARIRGLTDITFHTASILDAADFGEFDYIDCCGVLHHLPDPAAGFSALRQACAQGGGMGFMVYAPLGRSGVYPLQKAFGALFAGLPPSDRLDAAKKLMDQLPDGHPFKSNPNVMDHKNNDTGFYDLLLHSQDRAYAINELMDQLGETGWELVDMAVPALYDPTRITPLNSEMSRSELMTLAENLRGDMKTHVGYAVPQGRSVRVATGSNRALVPHLKGLNARQLANAVAAGKPVNITFGSRSERIVLPAQSASLLALINGRRNLAQISQAAKMDPVQFGAVWPKVEAELCSWGLMLYSSLSQAQGSV